MVVSYGQLSVPSTSHDLEIRLHVEYPPKSKMFGISSLFNVQYNRSAEHRIDGLGLKTYVAFQLEIHVQSPALCA